MFGRDRLREGARRLGQRLTEVRKSEEQDRLRQGYEASGPRDEMAAELAELYPQVEKRLSGLIGRIAANDREVAWVNSGRLPAGTARA